MTKADRKQEIKTSCTNISQTIGPGINDNYNGKDSSPELSLRWVIQYRQLEDTRVVDFKVTTDATDAVEQEKQML